MNKTIAATSKRLIQMQAQSTTTERPKRHDEDGPDHPRALELGMMSTSSSFPLSSYPKLLGRRLPGGLSPVTMEEAYPPRLASRYPSSE